MLNAIWSFMILIGVIYGVCTGRVSDVTNGALESAGDAVTLCITMAGTMALWMGLMEITKQSGLIAGLTKGISPFLDFMFPNIPGKHAAREYIAINLIANVLGLGGACTPSGLKAMEALAQLEKERGNNETELQASNEMCNFLILNIASLQLISVNMIAYRRQYGSVNPTGAIGGTIIATACSTVVAMIYCRWKDRKKSGGYKT